MVILFSRYRLRVEVSVLMGSSEFVVPKDILNSDNQISCDSKSFNDKLRISERDGMSPCCFGDDDLQVIEQIDRRISSVSSGSSQVGVNLSQKSLLKKPALVGTSRGSGAEISESMTLKQALRRLCISHASDMAATKRIARPASITGFSEAATIKKLYASVTVQCSESDPLRVKGTMVEVLHEKMDLVSSQKTTSSVKASGGELPNQKDDLLPQGSIPFSHSSQKTKIKDIIGSASTETGGSSKTINGTRTKEKQKLRAPFFDASSLSRSRKPTKTPRLVKPVFRNKPSSRRRVKQEPSASACHMSHGSSGYKKDAIIPNKNKSAVWKEPHSPAHGFSNLKGKDSKKNKNTGLENPETNLADSNAGRDCGIKSIDGSRSREKGECSQSSKSSIGDYSCSTSISDDSHLSGVTGCRPHMSKDVRWTAIHQFVMHHGTLCLKNFKLLKKLGCGDIGTVYLSELVGTGCLFALKVMDIEFLLSRKKMIRAQTEKEILEMLDHPFLPTLYAHFTTDNLACLVMEYCPGGDLHVLRQKQPGRSFTEPEARFYVAEVLLALEYLHMLGVIYRDLKPENILVRGDGHIMLSDFDLSLRCNANPALVGLSSLGRFEGAPKKLNGPCSENACIDPFCLQPSWVPRSCFTPHSTSPPLKSVLTSSGAGEPLQLVVEPIEARSNSFVGTHEYLAPEIIRGDGHGSAVDWWTLGIFLYELLFGRTPFKGGGNEETLSNVVSQSLIFPETPTVSFQAKDLIRALLSKEPESRLGYQRGAAELKQHSFFQGLNWALIRCAAPPEIPGGYGDPITTSPTLTSKKKAKKNVVEAEKCFRTNGGNVVFQLY